jgi:hypothetical protein
MHEAIETETATIGVWQMGDLTRGERMQIMLTPEELKALDDWRFEKRMPSRASAIRELLKRGLAAEGFNTAIAGEQSKAFGVVESPVRTEKDRKPARRAPRE